jgi:uncharacterized membrane protein
MTFEFKPLEKKSYYIMLALTFFGLIISLYLWYMYTLPEPVTCVGSAFNSCEIVRESSYSVFLGFLLPAWGSLYFFLSIILLILGYFKVKNIKEPFIALFLFSGLLFEARLAYIQLIVIKALCFWCTAIFLILIAINIFLFYKTQLKVVKP